MTLKPILRHASWISIHQHFPGKEHNIMSNINETKRTNQSGVHKSDERLFVERRPEGDYAIRKANSDRASAVLPTQAEAIKKARELGHGAAPVVERVRNTTSGKPDKWRKA
jgi:Uncharacterized protein conserved in bacteria (DUF2188)